MLSFNTILVWLCAFCIDSRCVSRQMVKFLNGGSSSHRCFFSYKKMCYFSEDHYHFDEFDNGFLSYGSDNDVTQIEGLWPQTILRNGN